jgi:hypothetical protein
MKHRLSLVAGLCLAVVIVGCGDSAPTADSAVADSESNQQVFELDHFADGAIVGDATTEDCTLSGGTETTCVRVTVAGYPTSYEVGPFCPETITTPAEDAGIWFDGSGIYDLDGPFIKNLAEFYNDSEWKLYDEEGNVNVTDTPEAFEGAARPDVAEEYQNHCVEGRLEWLANGEPIQTTMVIPTRPVKASTPSSAHPGNFGITFDGVVIAESAPVDAILGAHTIAALDDCGGHYNPVAGYHLHGVTGCGHLEGADDEVETSMFGYAADGFPIHLPLDEESSAAADLDECNGHTTAAAGYHYHANNAAKNAILPCLTGEYANSDTNGGRPQGPPPGGAGGAGQTSSGFDLATVAAQLGVTEHELEDAMATGDIDSAAEMLGTTADEIAATLGVSLADLQAVFGGATSKSTSASTARTSVDTTVVDLTDAIVNTWIGPPMDTSKLPIGTSKVSLDGPSVGGLYSCDGGNPNGGGAEVAGPWLNESAGTWDLSKKISVQGAVTWPMASYSEEIDGSSRVITSNGLPVNEITGTFPIAADDPAYSYDRNANRIAGAEVMITLPLQPVKATSPTCLGKGRIGVMKNGVALYASLDQRNRDAAAYETQDKCDGHPQQASVYHYHEIPSCIRDAATGSSTVVGFANDGFPIVVERDANGDLPTNADLDVCHGRTSLIQLDGKLVEAYHYSATYEFPYFIGCFTGKPIS